MQISDFVKSEPTEDSEVVKRTYRYTQHGHLTIRGWSEKFEEIKLYCLVVYLPVDEKKERPELTLIAFSNIDKFKDLSKEAFYNMLHIEVQIKKNLAHVKLPGEDVSFLSSNF